MAHSLLLAASWKLLFTSISWQKRTNQRFTRLAETRDETRTDLIINYNNHEYVIELKIWRGDSYNTKGENQLLEYLALKKQKTGYLVSFCFNKGKTPGLLPSVEQDGLTLIEVIV